MSVSAVILTPRGAVVAADTASAAFHADGTPYIGGYGEKIAALSRRRPFVITGWGRVTPSTLDECRRRFDGADPDWTRALEGGSSEHVARLVSEALAADLTPLFSGTRHYYAGHIVGHDSAWLFQVDSNGLTVLRRVWPPGYGGIALPPSCVAAKALRPKYLQATATMTLERASEVAAELVQAEIDRGEQHPGADYLFGGPVSVVALEPGEPVRWLCRLPSSLGELNMSTSPGIGTRT
jgi:hypothetical protein